MNPLYHGPQVGIQAMIMQDPLREVMAVSKAPPFGMATQTQHTPSMPLLWLPT